MLSVRVTKQFRKDVKKARKQGKPLDTLKKVMQDITEGETFSSEHQDHALIGSYNGNRECHLSPDWLLIYDIEDDAILGLVATGTHADLFR